MLATGGSGASDADGGWDAAALCYFVACGISRLARYNVTAAALSDETGKVKYYEGTPIPSSLALVLVLGAVLLLQVVERVSPQGGDRE